MPHGETPQSSDGVSPSGVPPGVPQSSDGVPAVVAYHASIPPSLHITPPSLLSQHTFHTCICFQL
ncbi:MAG: hypothetical protein IKN52_10065 [Victivallales bacterium]|nr:hypothetical protein [Victivallales bacterium]